MTKMEEKEKYGIRDYITYIRPLLSPKMYYLLATCNGTQHRQLSSILARMTYLALGKYIHPTRYRCEDDENT